MKLKQLMVLLVAGMLLLAGCGTTKSSNEKEKDPAVQTDATKKEDEEQEVVAPEEGQEETNEVDETNENDAEATNDADNQETADNSDIELITFEDITFEIPKGLTPVPTEDAETEGMPMVGYFIEPADGTNFNVLVETLPMEMSLDKYIELATAQTGFDYLSKENYSANGMDWNESVSNLNGYQLNQRTFILDDKAYVFSFASLPENYDEHLKVYKDITDSVKVQ